MADFAVMQQLDPVGYYRQFTKNGVRLDGRGFSDIRLTSVGAGDFSTSSTYGSSLVHIGETKVACSISVLIGTPSQQYPGSGDVGTTLLSANTYTAQYRLQYYVFEVDSCNLITLSIRTWDVI